MAQLEIHYDQLSILQFGSLLIIDTNFKHKIHHNTSKNLAHLIDPKILNVDYHLLPRDSRKTHFYTREAIGSRCYPKYSVETSLLSPSTSFFFCQNFISLMYETF